MLKSLAHHHHDEFILMAVLAQPNDMNRFHVEFGYFNWLKITQVAAYQDKAAGIDESNRLYLLS
ncbi:hypothetical protein J2Y79_000535 [Bacillus velezensis]|nr:hypothetical protein [Bacillus velezensis]